MSQNTGIVDAYTCSDAPAAAAGGMGGNNGLQACYMDAIFSDMPCKTSGQGVLGFLSELNMGVVAELDNGRCQFQSEVLGGKAAQPKSQPEVAPVANDTQIPITNVFAQLAKDAFHGQTGMEDLKREKFNALTRAA